jgi:hypothetical protein
MSRGVAALQPYGCSTVPGTSIATGSCRAPHNRQRAHADVPESGQCPEKGARRSERAPAAPVAHTAWRARAQVLTVVFGQDLADESAGAAQQVFSVGVAVGGLAAFALVLALIEQVVLQARPTLYLSRRPLRGRWARM